MVRTALIRIGLVGMWLAAGALPARADASALLGATFGSPQPAVAVSFGLCPSVVGFEIEYATSLGAGTADGPGVRSVSVNVIIQSTPLIHGLQFYGDGGFGVYGEFLDNGLGSGEIAAKNIGSGAKIGRRARRRAWFRDLPASAACLGRSHPCVLRRGAVWCC